MALHKDVWWLLGSVAAAVAAAPLIVHGDAQTTARRTAATQKIEQLSPAERQELEENFARFKKLPPVEQAKYREIHDKIQQNPSVAEALDAYSHWWSNVSAREQAEVVRQSDVKQRIAAVGRVQEELDNERGARMFFGSGWRRDRFGPPIPTLPRDSLFEVLRTIETLAAESLAIQQELPEVQKIDPKSPQRYQKLLIALHEHKKNWSDLISNASVENRLLESITDSKTRESFRQRLGGNSRGYFARFQLAMSLGRELMYEGLKQKLGEDELKKKLNSLSDDEKAELYTVPGLDALFRLRMRVTREAWQDSQAGVDFFELRPPRADGERGGGPDANRGPEGGRGPDGGRGRDGGRDGERGGPRGDGERGGGGRPRPPE
ncbi:hypothetical protein AYO47_02395 [Planctomyces sp. SCGC AG-212-M04]|nr:hypothetical protein AYO47_02395 [Planctomyces sp. SCGC AG-212-M04]